MIDLFFVLVSTGLCLLIAVRAVILDNSVPWFTPEKPSDDAQSTLSGKAPRQQPPAAIGGLPNWRMRAGVQARKPG